MQNPSMPKIQFDIALTGDGWAEATITNEDDKDNLLISYAGGDSLKEFLQALMTLLQEPEREIRCPWMYEPGYNSLILTQKTDALEIKVIVSNSPFRQSLEGTLEFTTDCDVWDFIQQVLHGYRQMLETHGMEGYRQLWHADFPSQEYMDLLHVFNAHEAKE